MSDNSDVNRLRQVLALADDIDRIVVRHGSVEQATADFEGRYALLMCLLQAGETLNRVEADRIRRALPLDLTYTMRNLIAYNAAGINARVLERTITADLPKLKNGIVKLLGE